jgi:hypothetical protein
MFGIINVKDIKNNMSSAPQNKLISFIKENWVLIAFTVGIITTWANFINADAQADKRLTNLETKTESIKSIEVQLSQIQTDLQWIKLNLK